MDDQNVRFIGLASSELSEHIGHHHADTCISFEMDVHSEKIQKKSGLRNFDSFAVNKNHIEDIWQRMKRTLFGKDVEVKRFIHAKVFEKCQIT